MRRVTIIEQPLEHPNPGGQRDFLTDFDHRYVAYAAGWGSGKTWAGARKLLTLHVYNAVDSGGRLTGVKGLVLAPTYQLAWTVLIPELSRALEAANLQYVFISDPRRSCFVLPQLGTAGEPSEILIRSAERPDRIAGFEVGHLWGDEAGRWHQNDANPMDDAMLQAEGRLRAPRANLLQANYTFTHEGDCTRVYQRFEEQCGDDGEHALYRGATEENPLMREYAREKRRQLSPELAGQYLDGQAISRRGSAVYGSFAANRNVDGELQLSDALPLHLSIDFNIDPGMHAIIGQHFIHEGLLTAVHEIHQPRMDVRRMIHALRELIEEAHGGWRWPGLWIFGDASGSGVWAGSGQSCWDIVAESLRQAGILFSLKVPRSNPPVADRVNAFNCALYGIDGATRYRVHPRCQALCRDLKEMRWRRGEPDKSNNRLSHAADAEGYRVHWLMPIRPLRLAGKRSSVGFSK